MIGNGSMVLHRAVIHSGAIVAANAVVLADTDVPSGALAVGTPATIKPGKARMEDIRIGRDAYVQRIEEYRTRTAAARLSDRAAPDDEGSSIRAFIVTVPRERSRRGERSTVAARRSCDRGAGTCRGSGGVAHVGGSRRRCGRTSRRHARDELVMAHRGRVDRGGADVAPVRCADVDRRRPRDRAPVAGGRCSRSGHLRRDRTRWCVRARRSSDVPAHRWFAAPRTRHVSIAMRTRPSLGAGRRLRHRRVVDRRGAVGRRSRARRSTSPTDADRRPPGRTPA